MQARDEMLTFRLGDSIVGPSGVPFRIEEITEEEIVGVPPCKNIPTKHFNRAGLLEDLREGKAMLCKA